MQEILSKEMGRGQVQVGDTEFQVGLAVVGSLAAWQQVLACLLWGYAAGSPGMEG